MRREKKVKIKKIKICVGRVSVSQRQRTPYRACLFVYWRGCSSEILADER